MKASGVISVLFAVPLLALPSGAQEPDRGAAADPCASPTIVGTAKPDRLNGTPGPDIIDGAGGSDRIWGQGGDDILCGGGGADLLRGGTGDDQLYGEQDREFDDIEDGPYYEGDILAGGPGNDLLNVGDDPRTTDAEDTLDFSRAARGVTVDLPAQTATGEGADLIVGPVGAVYGSEHADHVIGTELGEDIKTRSGADTVEAGAGNDLIRVGPSKGGDDGRNVVDAGPGNDWVTGGGRGDRLTGGEGNDTLQGDQARELLGGPGRDWLSDQLVRGVPQVIDGGSGPDELALSVPDEWRGTHAVLSGRLDLAAGTTVFRSERGSVEIITRGFDNADLLATGRWTVVGTAGPNLLIVESSRGAVLIGRAGDDELLGTSHGDALRGGAGRDAAWGRGGPDRYASVEKRL